MIRRLFSPILFIILCLPCTTLFMYLCNSTDYILLIILYGLLHASAILIIMATFMNKESQSSFALFPIMLVFVFFSLFGAGMQVRVGNFLTKNVVRNISVNDANTYKKGTVFYFNDGTLAYKYQTDHHFESTTRSGSLSYARDVIPIVPENWQPEDTIKVWACSEWNEGTGTTGSFKEWNNCRSGYELLANGKNNRKFFETIINRRVQHDDLISSVDAKLIIISSDPDNGYIRRERIFFIVLFTALGLILIGNTFFGQSNE